MGNIPAITLEEFFQDYLRKLPAEFNVRMEYSKLSPLRTANDFERHLTKLEQALHELLALRPNHVHEELVGRIYVEWHYANVLGRVMVENCCKNKEAAKRQNETVSAAPQDKSAASHTPSMPSKLTDHQSVLAEVVKQPEKFNREQHLQTMIDKLQKVVADSKSMRARFESQKDVASSICAAKTELKREQFQKALRTSEALKQQNARLNEVLIIRQQEKNRALERCYQLQSRSDKRPDEAAKLRRLQTLPVADHAEKGHDDQLERFMAGNQRLVSRIEELQKQVSLKEVVKKDLAEQLSKNTAQVEEKRQQLEQKRAQCHLLQRNYTELWKERETERQEMSELKHQVKQLQDKLSRHAKHN